MSRRVSFMKKSCKAIACLMAACMVLGAFAGCSADFIEKVDPTSAPPVTETPTEEPIDPTGGMVGSRYVNEAFGLQFIPGDGWDYILEPSGVTSTVSPDGTVEDPGLVMDAADANGNNASVVIQYVGSSSGVTGESFAAEAKAQMETSFADVASSLEVTTDTVEFLGKECVCNDVVAISDDTPVYEKLIYLLEGDYVATVLITSSDSAMIEDIAYMFSAQ